MPGGVCQLHGFLLDVTRALWEKKISDWVSWCVWHRAFTVYSHQATEDNKARAA